MLTSSFDVGFYSYMWLWCLAIPDKRRRSLSPRFFICLNLGTWTDTQTIILITKLKTMKTKFFNYLLMGAFAIMSSVAFISCSSDDDDNAPAGDGGNNAPRDEYGVYTEGKKLKSYSIGGTCNLFYDTNKRLSKTDNCHYVWSEDKVEMLYDDGEVSRTYILNNGLVTKIIDRTMGEIKLSYNANRQLVKKEYRWDVTKYTWNSGRITKITDDESVSTFKYEETCKGYYPPTDGYINEIWNIGYVPENLLYAHPELFGLRMNHLPSKVIYKEYDDGELEYEETIEYVYSQHLEAPDDEDGYVTICLETINREEGEVNNTYHYDWE